MSEDAKPWTRFVEVDETINRAIGKKYRTSDMPGAPRVFLNSRYQVARWDMDPPHEGWPRMVHLSIKNVDKSARHDWRDFQRLKNELLGPEWEGVELYPAESRLVDTANQYHLFCVEQRFPFGFVERLVAEDDPKEPLGGKQRPFDPDVKPSDLTKITRKMLDDALTSFYGAS